MGWQKDNGNGRYAKTAGDFAQAQGDYAQAQAGAVTVQADYAQEQGDYAKAQGDAALTAAAQGTAYQASVDSRVTTFEDDVNTRVTDVETTVANGIGAFTDSTEVVTARGGSVNLGARLDKTDAQLAESARSTSTLVSGSSIVEGDVDTVAEVEFEGRTLTSLANSNLEALKYYALMDKKTKVIVDKNTVTGVGKFVKAQTTLTTGDFVGKTENGVTTVNPHRAYGPGSMNSATSLYVPTSTNWYEFRNSYPSTVYKYSSLESLNGTHANVTATANTAIAQQLFSFNIIEQIERNLGIIPVATLAEKVQWVKDNVSTIRADWHGFGSSVGGNKATFKQWNGTAWTTGTSHTSATVTKLTEPLVLSTAIGTDGMAHLLSHAEPSDGATASTINTDFINCEITLKSTAQLNTRPTIVRVENFEGKVSGSVVENAHTAHNGKSATLLAPTAFTSELSTTAYGNSNKLEGTLHTYSTTVNGEQAQDKRSFNLIEAIERNIGKIPASDTAGKVAWLKANVARWRFNWHGFGSSVGGNKATVSVFQGTASQYYTSAQKVNYDTHSLGSVTALTASHTGTEYLTSDGYLHLLAYANASDGVTASVINTDYIDLEIELKPTANFTAPKVPLYEVTLDDYNKIGVSWTEEDAVKRFPAVEGTQHLTNAYVVAEVENLLPPFTEWSLHANAKVLSPYELELNATGGYQTSNFTINIISGQTYNISSSFSTASMYIDVLWKGSNGESLGSTNTLINSATPSRNITAPVTAKTATINASNSASGTFTFKNPMLNLGTTAKPFVPRNPSYLYTNAKLGAIGDKKDILFKQDGQWKLRKSVEKDVVLGGDLAWSYSDDYTGFKRVFAPIGVAQNYTSSVINKFNGEAKKGLLTFIAQNGESYTNANGNFYTFLPDADTGFGETYTPSTAEVKAYFYGYQLNNGTFGVPFNGTGTKTWIPLGDTSNARGVTTAPIAPSPTQVDGTIKPYRLSYVLATPTTSTVTSDVEGSVKVNGSTQFTVGSGMQRTVVDGKSTWAQLSPKSAYTSNATNVKVTYAKNVRSALEDVTGKTQDNETQLSVHEKAIVDLYVRLKAIGG